MTGLSTVEGAVLGVYDGILLGWAWDTADPERIVIVEVLGTEGFYIRVAADGFQPDLEASGKRNGLCGLALQLPEELLENGAVSVAAIVGGTLDALKPVGGADHAVLENWVAQQGSLLKHLLVQRIYWELTGDRAPKSELDSAVAGLDSDPVGALSTLVQRVACKRLPTVPTDDDLKFTVNDVVKGVYNGILKRDPEPRGYEVYGNGLRGGLTLKDFIGELTKTAEYQNRIVLPPESADNSTSAIVPPEMTRLAAAMERALLTIAMEAASTAPPAREAPQTTAHRAPAHKSHLNGRIGNGKGQPHPC